MFAPFDDVPFGNAVVASAPLAVQDRFVAVSPRDRAAGPVSVGSVGSDVASSRAAPAGQTRSGAAPADTDWPPRATATDDVAALDISSLGPLAHFASAPGVTDLCVNGASGLWTDDGHGLDRQAEWRLDESSVRALAVKLIALGGRHIDEASPCVDVRLGDGIRVHAVLPPISSTGTLLSIRLPSRTRLSLAALADAGLCGTGTGGETSEATAVLSRLRAIVAARENFLITGAAGSGKTTLLAAMLGEVPPGERMVVIEDVAELRIEHPHVVGLEGRQANLEGAGHVGLERLVREALRMRPDRLVLGECRGSEVRELLAALNTGHDGGAGTLHANSVSDVPARLEALGALAGMSQEAIARQTVSALSWVVHLERSAGLRQVRTIARFELDGSGRLAVASG